MRTVNDFQDTSTEGIISFILFKNISSVTLRHSNKPNTKWIYHLSSACSASGFLLQPLFEDTGGNSKSRASVQENKMQTRTGKEPIYGFGPLEAITITE